MSETFAEWQWRFANKNGRNPTAQDAFDALTSAPAEPASLRIDFKQATDLLAMFADEPNEITLTHYPKVEHHFEEGFSISAGLYAHYTDMPEEGSIYLGVSDQEAMPDSPAETPPAAGAIEVVTPLPETIEEKYALWARLSQDKELGPIAAHELGEVLRATQRKAAGAIDARGEAQQFLDRGLADVQDEGGVNTYYSEEAVLECIAAALASRDQSQTFDARGQEATRLDQVKFVEIAHKYLPGDMDPHKAWLFFQEASRVLRKGIQSEYSAALNRGLSEYDASLKVVPTPAAFVKAEHLKELQGCAGMSVWAESFAYHEDSWTGARDDRSFAGLVPLFVASREEAPAAAGAAQAVARTPEDYAIEHAEYMAVRAEHLLAAVQEHAAAHVAREDDGNDPDSDEDISSLNDRCERANEGVTEAMAKMRDGIHEFRKRKDRALAATPAPEADPNAPWLTEAHMLCTEQGIPQGHIADRIKALRVALDAPEAAETASTEATLADDETCDLIGIKADGTRTELGKAPIPPMMKARDVVRSYFGGDVDDEMSDASMALQCCREVIDYMKRATLKAAQPVEREDGK